MYIKDSYIEIKQKDARMHQTDSDKDALDLKIITILGSFGQKLILGRNNRNRNPMWDYIYQININPNRLRYGSKLSYGL